MRLPARHVPPNLHFGPALLRCFACARWLPLVALLALAFPLRAALPLGADPESPPKLPIYHFGLESGTTVLSHLDESGELDGFLVDLIREIGRERGFTPAFFLDDWPVVMGKFRAGELDALANMIFTPERDAYADFSIAHLMLPGAVYMSKSQAPLQSPSELRTKRMAVVKGGYSHDMAVKNGWGKEYIFARSLEDCLAKLNRGEADAVIGTRVFGDAIIRKHGLSNIHATPLKIPNFRFQYHMAVLEGHDSLLYELNAGLIALRNNGVYDRIYEKWIGPLEPRPLRWLDLKPYWLPALLGLLALVVAFVRQRQLLQRLQRQAHALRTSEERLSLVLQGSQDAFWDWDVSSGVVQRNARWSEIVSCSPGEISSHVDALDSLIHPEDLARVRQSRKSVLQAGHVRLEYRIRGKGGRWHWILDRGLVVARDDNGNPTRVTGAATDITVRKQMEEALARSQALLEQSQRSAEVGGWEFDVQSGALFWTLQSYRIYDMDSDTDTPTMQRLFAMHAPHSEQKLRDAFSRALADGTPFDLELEAVTARQRVVWVRATSRTEKNATQVVRVYGSFQDISQRKKAEEERQSLQLKMLDAQKLESLGVLAGGIAHDFNNLLTVVTGNASIARDDPASAPEALQQIEIAAQRAADLCRQMLAYAGKSRSAKEPIDLNAVVTDTVQLLKLSISKNASLEFSLEAVALPVQADPSQIRQVIMNLVINASDAIGGTPGTIRITTCRREVSAEEFAKARLGRDLPPGEYVSFEVSDNGGGMSEGTLARIFDPFFTTKFAGRGLGLAAVLGIVRAHGGAFFVQSKLGSGSTFCMLLPPLNVPEALRTATPIPTINPALKQAGHYLVVDDEPAVRKLAAAILERQGHKVTQASDGYEALALAAAHGGKFTAVILDLTMPGLDGPGTLRELRQMSTDLPILLMSGYSEANARQYLDKDRFLDFLPKPFTTEDLLRRLKALVERTA